ncbi:MAG: WD40 repeat domain-containing protein, partial [Nocardioides sp.]
HTMGRPDDELYRGTRLAQALEWRTRAAPDLTPVEVDYLSAADRRARAEEATAAEQARYQVRVNRRLRGLLIGAALLLVVAMVAGLLAVRQANRADDATASADARRVAAQAQLAGSVDQALMLAAAAQHVEDSPESRAGLLAALARIPQLSAVRPHGGIWLELSPDGRTLVTLDTDHKLWFHDSSTLELVGSYDPYPDRDVHGIVGWVSGLAYSTDGTRLAVALLDGNDGVVQVLDTATYEPVAAQPGGQPPGTYPSDVKLSHDGRYLAVSVVRNQIDDQVYVWDLARPGRPLRRIELPIDNSHLEFARGGRLLYTAPAMNSSAVGTGLRVYDVRTGKQVDRRSDGGHGLELSPDGRTLAYGRGSDVVLSEATTGAVRRRLRGSQGTVSRIAFSPDDRLVAAVSDDPAAYVWERGSGRLLETIPMEAHALDVAFDAEGERLFVPSADRLFAFDLTGEDRYVQQTTAADPVEVPAGEIERFLSPYAPAVVVSSWDEERDVSLLRVEDRSTGRTTTRLGPGWLGDAYDSHAWSPDGRHFAYGDVNDWLRIVDWRTGETLARRRFPVRHLAYTPDGARILAGRPEGLQLLDARTLSDITDPVSLPGRLIVHAVVGPGADTAVVVSAQDTGAVFDWFNAVDRWLVVDLQTGETLREGRLHEPATSMAVSPDRTRMAAAYPGGVEIIDLRSGDSTISTDTGSTAESEGTGVTFSPDGELLASAGGDGRVSLRTATTGALLGTIAPVDEGPAPVFLDDQALLMTYADGSTYVWDTSPTYALDTACRILGRGLTREEWREAFGQQPFEDVCE